MSDSSSSNNRNETQTPSKPTTQTVKRAKDLSRDDSVILFLGPTGSGKSHIIDVLSGRTTKKASSGLKSSTIAVNAIRVKDDNNRNLVLVDTPGFDDTHKTDFQILEIISKWLVEACRQEAKITGIIYLQRITDNRVVETDHRNLHVFSELCGSEAAKNVLLVTTMWDEMGYESPDGPLRETQLEQSLWKSILDDGAQTVRFENTHPSALNVVKQVREKKGVALLLQKEMVLDSKKKLQETKAAQALYTPLSVVLAKHAGEKQPSNPGSPDQLEAENRKLDAEIEQIMQDLSKYRSSLGRMVSFLRAYFSRRSRRG